jgi:uncharacterized protein YyaL (SSP411 family)
VQGVRTPLPAESALFVEGDNVLSPVARNIKTHSIVHCTKPKFPPEKALVIHKTNNFRQKTHSLIAQNQIFSPEKKYFFCNNVECQENA